MRNALAIFNRELKSYFTSPVAYAVLAAFLLIAGYFFYAIITSFMQYAMRAAMQAQYYQQAPPPINVNMMALRPFFHNISLVMIFIIPFITMRLYAEDKKTGTIELLFTSPIRTGETLFGKYAAALVLFCAMLGGTLIYQLMLFIYGRPELGQILSGYLGLVLEGATFIAIGIFISSLTENQLVAGFITGVLLLLFWVMGWAQDFAGPTLGAFLSYASLLTHFDEFAKGVIDFKDILLYLSYIAFFLFLTVTSVESMKWRTR